MMNDSKAPQESWFSSSNTLNWRVGIEQFKQNSKSVKIIATGVVIIFIISCIFTIVGYHNDQMTEVQTRLRSSENQWKKMASQLESRAKRNAFKMEKFMGISQDHFISKRSAGESRPITLVGGAVYIRWGRRDCPGVSPSRLIYSGVAAGAMHSHGGGGAKYLCLHTNLTYQDGHYLDKNQGSSYLYGVEWRDATWINELFDLSETMAKTLRYQNVPCALCLAGPRQGKIMIPGKYECPKGWVYEYDGYIMAAGHSNAHSTEYICVDQRPQVVPGTQLSQTSSSYLYMVETKCDSLLCEPIVDGREMRCVVCTV